MSIEQWTDKEDMVCIYKGYYSAIKKEWNNAICRNMDGPRDCHTMWSQTEKRQTLYNITYMWKQKKK